MSDSEIELHPVVRPSVRVGRLVHGFDDPEHKAAVREIMREVREMEEALEWIIAPDRPIGSDAEMVHVMEQTARKILKANAPHVMIGPWGSQSNFIGKNITQQNHQPNETPS